MVGRRDASTTVSSQAQARYAEYPASASRVTDPTALRSPASGGSTMESAAQAPTSASADLILPIPISSRRSLSWATRGRYHPGEMLPAPPPGSGHGGHGHRTWLHLLPQDPNFVPGPSQLEAAAELLVEIGLAARGPDPDSLRPGPTFAQLLLVPGKLPMAGPIRGEVRLEAGVLRCYPDPGPEGFDTDPLRTYTTDCPECGVPLEFFRLRFPYLDPMRAACPACPADVDISALPWSPRLPVARTELTFGDLEGRPSLRGSEFFGQLESLWATSLSETHVTL